MAAQNLPQLSRVFTSPFWGDDHSGSARCKRRQKRNHSAPRRQRFLTKHPSFLFPLPIPRRSMTARRILKCRRSRSVVRPRSLGQTNGKKVWETKKRKEGAQTLSHSRMRGVWLTVTGGGGSLGCRKYLSSQVFREQLRKRCCRTRYCATMSEMEVR